MLRALLAVWLCLVTAFGAAAEQVSVQSGEHDDFTRLVLDFAAPVGWQLTRTESGYRLALGRPDMRFDLSDVFRLIPRDRLSSIWADPETGALMLGIGCACHAFPFELRADVLVIDLRDGPAPSGSSFEVGADGRAMPPVAARIPARPRGRPETVAAGVEKPGQPRYNWLEQAGTGMAAAEFPALLPSLPSLPLPKDDASSLLSAAEGGSALRDELLRQISNGAARGTVELAPNQPKSRHSPPGGVARDPLSQIRIGGDAGVDPAAGDRPDHSLTAEGMRCLPDAAVDLGSWGDEAPVADAIGPRTGALFGEFDRVDRVAAETAVKYLLHLGFGVEAQILIETLPIDGSDAALWLALAAVADGDLATGGALAGMEICDSSVSLWALLSRPDLTRGEPVQTGAVLRAFSALPPHLRRHLGPTLAGRFLARGDAATVRAIRDAILRPGGDPGPAVRLMEAELHAAAGNGPDTAALVSLQSAPGRTAAAATIAATLAIVAEGGTIDMAMLTATEALLREYKGAEEEPALRHALALAQATQGNFDAAFALLPEEDSGRADLWALLADRGPEAALLTHALPGGTAQVLKVAPDTRQRMARRLIDAGFPDAALDWLNAGTAQEREVPDDYLLLAAEAELRRRDARAAIGLLAAVEGPEATRLRNQALLQLGTPEPLKRVQADASAAEGQRQQAARMALDWASVAAGGEDVWRDAAALVTDVAPPDDTSQDTPPPQATPPLARAKELLAQSVATRKALQDLMDATAPPPETQIEEGGT